MDATEEDRAGYIISRMVNDFTENAAELAGKYGAFSTVEVYTALSVLLCRQAVIEGLPIHALLEGILKTYRKFEEDLEVKQ